MNAFIELKSFPHEMFAQMASDYLSGQGIETFIKKDDCGGFYPQLQFAAGVRLMVAPEEQEKAKKILDEMDMENE